MAKFRFYKGQSFSCKCGWNGTGEQAHEGGDSSSCFPLLCPTCGKYLDWIDILESVEETLKYGTEKDKEEALKRQAFFKRVIAAELKSCDQLPEIEADEIVITLHEEEPVDGGDAYIVLSYQDKELWREVRSFEYYTRYLNLGELLKQKYGSRLVDFEAEYTVYLGGDYLSAFDKVRKFRKSLRNKPAISDQEFDYITRSGEFGAKDTTFWKALNFAKERHAKQKREDGTPYFEYILAVIEILRQTGYISDYIFTIAALHGIFENTNTTKDELYALLREYPDDETIETFRRIDHRGSVGDTLYALLHKNSSGESIVYYCDHAEAEKNYDRLNNGPCRDVISEVELLTRKPGEPFGGYMDRILDDHSIERENYRYNGAASVKLAAVLYNLTHASSGNPEEVGRIIRDTEDCIRLWRKKYTGRNVKYEDLFALIVKQLEMLKGE
jgi:hypothetical protein